MRLRGEFSAFVHRFAPANGSLQDVEDAYYSSSLPFTVGIA